MRKTHVAPAAFRIISSLAAAAALMLGGATAAHATDSTTPSMITTANTIDIAVQGPNDSLVFYWAYDGTSTWTAETVAGPGTAFSAPSMILNGNTIAISVMGPDD